MKKGKDFIGVGCGAFILDENNKLLLMKRNENCRNKTGYWTIPGGGVDFNEKVEDTIIREVKEELNVDIEVKKLLCVSNDIIPEESQHWVSSQFICEIIGGELKNLEPHKCEQFDWFDINDLPDKLTNTTIDGVKHLKEIL